MTDQRNLQNGIAATRLGEGNENTHYSQQMSGSISPLPYLSLPPTDQVQDLALDLFRTYKGNFPLNAYEIYRYLYIKYINSRGVQTTEPELTTFIQNAWSKESNKVREFYQTVESIYSKMLGTSHISVMSPNSSGLLSNSINLIQDDTGPDFCLFHANNLQSFGPPTPRSINASPSFDTSNIYGSRNDGDDKLFFPSLSDIQRRPDDHLEEFSADSDEFNFPLF